VVFMVWQALQLYISTCIPIAKKRVGKQISTTEFSMSSVPRLLLCNGSVNTLQQQRLCFLRGPCRGIILKTIGATRQLSVQLWSINQQATEAEVSPLLRFVTRKCLVIALQRNSHCREQLPRKD
jgi:hypothetical protein